MTITSIRFALCSALLCVPLAGSLTACSDDPAQDTGPKAVGTPGGDMVMPPAGSVGDDPADDEGVGTPGVGDAAPTGQGAPGAPGGDGTTGMDASGGAGMAGPVDTGEAGADAPDDGIPDDGMPGDTDYPGPPAHEPLDCGPDGWAVEDHGPPSNRVNYLILADGYDATTINTTLEEHIHAMLDERFNHEKGEPYGRYRKFVNICVAKVVSPSNGIGNGPTAFDGGNGGDRLARVNQSKVTDYINANVPSTFEIDWNAVVLNQNKWENTGSILMLWSGAGNDAPGAALHEGGHGFHQLADEYCAGGTGTRCGAEMCGGGGTEYAEVNTTGDCSDTAGKWDLWLGSTQKGLKVPDMGATGLQSTFIGSRYVDSGQYRPSGNSMMNSLFGDDVNTSFNSVSREQMIFGIWRAVEPIDATEPEAGDAGDATRLIVHVIDPEVINVEWSVDGNVVAENGGPVFDVTAAGLSAGSHTISARAYDNADEDLVRNRSGVCPDSVTGRYCHGTGWTRSEQSVSWTITTD